MAAEMAAAAESTSGATGDGDGVEGGRGGNGGKGGDERDGGSGDESDDSTESSSKLTSILPPPPPPWWWPRNGTEVAADVEVTIGSTLIRASPQVFLRTPLVVISSSSSSRSPSSNSSPSSSPSSSAAAVTTVVWDLRKLTAAKSSSLSSRPRLNSPGSVGFQCTLTATVTGLYLGSTLVVPSHHHNHHHRHRHRHRQRQRQRLDLHHRHRPNLGADISTWGSLHLGAFTGHQIDAPLRWDVAQRAVDEAWSAITPLDLEAIIDSGGLDMTLMTHIAAHVDVDLLGSLAGAGGGGASTPRGCTWAQSRWRTSRSSTRRGTAA